MDHRHHDHISSPLKNTTLRNSPWYNILVKKSNEGNKGNTIYTFPIDISLLRKCYLKQHLPIEHPDRANQTRLTYTIPFLSQRSSSCTHDRRRKNRDCRASRSNGQQLPAISRIVRFIEFPERRPCYGRSLCSSSTYVQGVEATWSKLITLRVQLQDQREYRSTSIIGRWTSYRSVKSRSVPWIGRVDNVEQRQLSQGSTNRSLISRCTLASI